MKITNFILFIFHLFDLSFAFTPIWDIKKSSIDLTPSEGSSQIKKIYEQSAYNLHALLTKNITKLNSEIKDQNYIRMIDNEINNETNWRDIDKSYFINGVGHFICPKGKNFLNQYDNWKLFEMVPTEFTEVDDWELICFYHDIPDGGGSWKWIFQGFLNTNLSYTLYGKKINKYDSTDWIGQKLDRGLFDFIWSTQQIETSQKYNMYALTLKSKGIYLHNFTPQIWGSGWNRGDDLKYKLIDYKSNDMQAYFDQDSKIFYWMTSNGTTDNFRSGYSTEAIDLSSNEIDYGIIMNTISPFIFLNEVNIIKLKLLRNTRFIYYEVSEKKNNKVIYKGIIDIEINQIILNTNENFKKFEPLTNYSIFAIKEKKAYEICFIKYNNSCVKRCPSDTLFVLNNIDGNHCESTCKNYILKSNNVCSDYCNNTFYSFIIDENNQKICGLCKDLNSLNPYKIINKDGCLETKPNNTYFFNEEFYLLKYCSDNCRKCSNSETCDECEDGYKALNGICGRCYNNCEICSQFDGNDNIQHCTKCKKGLLFFNESGEGNCLYNCPNGTYKNKDICSKCHANCKTCNKGPKDENEYCETCNDEDFLIKIDGYGSNCVNECPNGTNATNISGIYYCIKIEDSEKEKEKEKDSFIINIYIIFIGICLFILTICIYKNICCNKKTKSELITQIHTELQDNNKLID